MIKNKNISIFYLVVKWIFKNIFAKYYKVQYIGLDKIKEINSNYLVLPNHIGFFDPFFINAPLNVKIHYIVSDTQFRNPFIGFLLKKMGAIPITKNRSDFKSLKMMTTAARSGKVIGLFPEGMRNWDGKALPLIDSTAKLIRMLNIPVIVPIIEGGYFMDPRWGKGFRRGEVFITYNILFNGSKPGRLKTDEIINELSTVFKYNEYKSEKLKGIVYKGKNRAENIEQLIYVCPECESISSFTSKGNNFSCHCGLTVNYTKEGILKSEKYKNIFNNTVDWNNWQKLFLENYITSKNDEILSRDSNLLLSEPNSKGSFQVKQKGSLSVFKDRLEFVNKDCINKFFLKDITGLNVQFKERLEFYYNGKIYRIHNKNQKFSAKKINDMYGIIKKVTSY